MGRLTALEALAASDPDMAQRIVKLLLHRPMNIIEVGSHDDRQKLDRLDQPDYDNGESEIFIRVRVISRRGTRIIGKPDDPLAHRF